MSRPSAPCDRQNDKWSRWSREEHRGHYEKERCRLFVKAVDPEMVAFSASLLEFASHGAIASTQSPHTKARTIWQMRQFKVTSKS